MPRVLWDPKEGPLRAIGYLKAGDRAGCDSFADPL